MKNLSDVQVTAATGSRTGCIDRIADQFETAWKTGSRPRIEDFLPGDWASDHEALRKLVLELIATDLPYRWIPAVTETRNSARHEEETVPGEPAIPCRPLLSDYAARYPAVGSPEQWPSALIAQEYRVRQKWGDRPGREKHLRQFPSRIADLTPRLIEIDAEMQSDENSLPSISPGASRSTGGDRAAPAPTLEQFVQTLTRSGLLSDTEVSAFLAARPPEDRPPDAESLARELVREKKLTKFQCRAVYQGKTRGLAFGEYVVLDSIGAGGMGRVLKARHRSMDRIVALKLLPAKWARAPEAIKRFQREVRAAARLLHPNIVTAYDAGQHNGLHYLVMEYVDGEDLGRIVSRQGPLSVAEAVDCILQAARALDYAHRCGIVHRDIKPANLLQDRQGTVKILDMGLARMEEPAPRGEAGTDTLTSSGQAMGTFEYMAPEQAEDTHRADHRADIYSLGCTLYKLLTGRPPYSGETVVQMILAHRDQPIPSLRDARPEIPESLDTILQKTLAKRPEDRYQSMAEVIAAMEACVSPSSAPPAVQIRTAQPKQVARCPQAWKVRIGLTMASLLLVLAVVITVRNRHGQTTPIEVPDESKVTVDADGSLSFELPSRKAKRSLGGGQKPAGEAAPSHLVTGDSAAPDLVFVGDYALEFDGTSHVTAESLHVDWSSPCTVEAWCVPADMGVEGGVVGISWGSLNANRGHWRLSLSRQAQKTNATSPEEITRGRPVHLAGVYDGRQISLFIDGRRSATCAVPEGHSHYSPPLRIGCMNTGTGVIVPGNFFRGTIGAVRISSSARYTDDFAPQVRHEPDEHTMALYRFDEGSGNILKDSSGNGHDAKIVGATWVKVAADSKGASP